MNLTKNIFALEAIKHQQDTILKSNISKEISKIRAEGKVNVASAIPIAKVINLRTNLNVSITLVEGSAAHVLMPDIDKNNPIINYYRRPAFTGKDTVKLLKKTNKPKGTVDLANSVVTGIWAELPIEIVLGREYLLGKLLTPNELAAVIAHEVGHPFTYFTALGGTLTANHAIQAVLADQDFGSDNKLTHEIMAAADGSLGIKVSNKDKLAKGNKDAYIASVLSEVAIKQKSELGTSIYDERGCEVLADQFATRHGLGMDLVTALDKIQRQGKASSYWSTPVFMLVETVKVLGFLSMFSGGAIGGMYIAGVLLTNPTRAAYDKPGQRAKRIRDQVVSALKDSSLSKPRRKDLLSQLEAIDNTMSEINDRETFYEFMWSNVLPWGTKETSSKELQENIETLLNNDFYVNSQRLKALA